MYCGLINVPCLRENPVEPKKVVLEVPISEKPPVPGMPLMALPNTGNNIQKSVTNPQFLYLLMRNMMLAGNCQSS